MGWLLGIFGTRASLYALAAVIVSAVGVTLWDRTHIHVLQHEKAELAVSLSKEKNARLIEHNEAEALAKAAKDKFDAQHLADLQRIKTAEDERDKAQAQATKFAAQYRAADKLRSDAISAFARGSGSAADAASAQSRADALGAVLQEALRVAGELAVESEDNARNARLLYDAWPR